MRAKTFKFTGRACATAAALLILLSTAALAGPRISNIDVACGADRVVIHVQGTAALHVTPFSSAKRGYLGFSFPCALKGEGRCVSVHSGRISTIRYSNFSNHPPVTRIVINSYSSPDYSTEWSAGKTHVRYHYMEVRPQARGEHESENGKWKAESGERKAIAPRGYLGSQTRRSPEPAGASRVDAGPLGDRFSGPYAGCQDSRARRRSVGNRRLTAGL